MQDCEVGVLGVGRMGGGIAARYLRAGLPTGVYDVDPARMREMGRIDAELAESPADLARHCSLISVVVRGDDLEAACSGPNGLFPGLQPGSVLALHTSTPPAAIRRLATEIEARGARVLEAAMTGGVGGAATGNLTLMCAGDPGLLEECWPRLRHIAKRRMFLGPLGAAGICKAIQDVLFGIYHHTTNEMVQLATAAGVDPDRLFEVMIAKGSVADRWTDLWARDGRELVGAETVTNPRSAIGGFATWLWALADELGVDVTTSRDTVARSMAVFQQQLQGLSEQGRGYTAAG
ncbi:MAG TPA: NAD(P)-binding domain-containing protein [Chloroflexota bacterium]|nr:NAD(P)-binding domain-containing protein [Chloroflexota bacterium]